MLSLHLGSVGALQRLCELPIQTPLLLLVSLVIFYLLLECSPRLNSLLVLPGDLDKVVLPTPFLFRLDGPDVLSLIVPATMPIRELRQSLSHSPLSHLGLLLVSSEFLEVISPPLRIMLLSLQPKLQHPLVGLLLLPLLHHSLSVLLVQERPQTALNMNLPRPLRPQPLVLSHLILLDCISDGLLLFSLDRYLVQLLKLEFLHALKLVDRCHSPLLLLYFLVPHH